MNFKFEAGLAPADDIARNCAKAMAIIDSEFTRFGLVLNHTKGKTEVLIVFRGKDSYKYRVLLLVDSHGILSFVNDQGITKYLRLTDQYKNLGSQVTVSGSHGPGLSYG